MTLRKTKVVAVERQVTNPREQVSPPGGAKRRSAKKCLHVSTRGYCIRTDYQGRDAEDTRPAHSAAPRVFPSGRPQQGQKWRYSISAASGGKNQFLHRSDHPPGALQSARRELHRRAQVATTPRFYPAGMSALLPAPGLGPRTVRT